MSDQHPSDRDQDPETAQATYLAEHDLADPDTLKPGDDFRAYLKDGVPDLLRRRALRALWRSNPILANVDGLVDYGEDFTDAAMVPDILATVYKVGKGMVDQSLKADEEDPAEQDVADIPLDIPDLGRSPEVSLLAENAEIAPAKSPENDMISEGSVPQAPPAKRMQFRFES
ncbi:DUF3306 domain-containing protein [Actibacterium sp. 188UL27-1]|uniref:DUF3306 domain-containing protein n=1 Tax=Actibacterium sp. 188UL27-1 TaxID=2786961 RepID=UPI00195B794C|nr:DUF3306 domain-containing protein [Actibacterium sp. 188UL27-1]MBM7066963.1 DUF3306 domain-containing protein [Actibacterium sp. 188UL27-1]